MSVLTDIRAFLIAQSLVEGATGWKCYIGVMPDETDKAVSLVPAGGSPYDMLNDQDVLPRFVLRVRNARLMFEDGEAKIVAVNNALKTADRSAISLPGFTMIRPSESYPNHWPDAKERNNFSFTYDVKRDAA